MKNPKGFGKNYFSLMTIQAYSQEVTLLSISNTFSSFLKNILIYKSDKEENNPPINFLFATLSQTDKPCHCNKIFKIKTRLIILLNHFIPRCPYYTTYFAFRRTGVHPPL
ncbi:MAG: hypothetical protein KGZ62_08460 [Sulfurimonas sp.]|jgi:hypothetical protein|nr:hypothetical protein [Sulfurimonas sp.]